MQPLLILLFSTGKEGTSGLKWLGEGQTTELEICESAEGSAAPRAPAVQNIYHVLRGPSFAGSKDLSQGYRQRHRPSAQTLSAFCFGNHLQNCHLEFVSDFTQKYWHTCCYDKAKAVIMHNSSWIQKLNLTVFAYNSSKIWNKYEKRGLFFPNQVIAIQVWFGYLNVS